VGTRRATAFTFALCAAVCDFERPAVHNATQADTDGDDLGDAGDLCTNVAGARNLTIKAKVMVSKISGEFINPPSAFVDEDLAFLAKIFSALDQVLQADWVAGGMQAARVADLIERMRTLVGRVIAR
jgi:hypothetical protein